MKKLIICAAVVFLFQGCGENDYFSNIDTNLDEAIMKAFELGYICGENGLDYEIWKHKVQEILESN